MTKRIKVRFAGVKEDPKGAFTIFYIPDQTQVLEAGKKYEIVVLGLDYERLRKEKQSNGSQASGSDNKRGS